MALEYLHNRAIGNWQLRTAEGFYLAQWAKVVCSTFKFEEIVDEEVDIDPETEKLAHVLNGMISDSTWLDTQSNSRGISAPQSRLAYTITILNLGFCKLFDVIVMVLLSSITSDQAKTRSRSLKSVISMLETDPNLLDRDPTVIRAIFRCASDQSPMVRDSALSLIAKSMALTPALEEEACKVILGCAADPTVGVRKRCLGLMKEIYLRDSRRDLKAAISKALLERTVDHEDSVAVLARQTLIDLWIAPLSSSMASGSESAKSQVAVAEQAALVVMTVSQHPDSLLKPLENFFKNTLKIEAKSSDSMFDLCKRFVASLFDRIVSNAEASSNADQESLLLTLTAFAKADAKLVVPEQLKAFQPYIGNLVTADDLFFFRSIVVVYRCVLPHLSSIQKPLLIEIQNDLFKTVSKLARAELNEVMACLWTIDGVLKNTDRLVKLTVSVLKGIHQGKISIIDPNSTASQVDETNALNRMRSYVRIAGCVGKHCDLERYVTAFRHAFPSWKGDSVAGLMADLICPLTAADQPFSLRIMALESLGAICQSWPGQFNKEPIQKSFSSIFGEKSTELEGVVLKIFAEFFGIREGANNVSIEVQEAERDQELGRLGGSLKASDHDGAAALIAQHFLTSILDVSVIRQDANTLTAVRVIASINRQGLVHPKVCAGALVALETSTDPTIANIAFESHKMMHQQHETMFEREYMRAVQEAYYYQKNVVGDPAGATVRPFHAKLSPLFEVIKSSNAKYVRKFLSNIILRTNFDLSKLESSQSLPEHVLLTRFIMQNLAFLEFGRLDELLHTILHLENVVGKTGADVAQAIDTQLHGNTSLLLTEDLTTSFNHSTSGSMPDLKTEEEERREALPDPTVLKQLTTAAMVLTMLWETRTHLRRQYQVSQDVRQMTAKNNDAKDLSKTPTKAHGVTGDKFWDKVCAIMTSLDGTEAMLARCHDFSVLMTVDDEVKVAAEDDDRREAFSTSVDPEETASNPGIGGKGSRAIKRKSTASIGGTPKKKRGRPSLNGRSRSSARWDDDEDGEWD